MRCDKWPWKRYVARVKRACCSRIVDRLKRPVVAWLFSLLVLHTGAEAADAVRLTNGEWPPFLAEQYKHHGLASRIVSEAFALEGVKVEYGFFPWARAYRLAESGEWEGSVVWRSSPQRKELFFISDPVIPDKVVFFHLKSRPFDWKTTADLVGTRIVATRNYLYGEDFEAAEKAKLIEVDRVNSDKLGFSMLLRGRVDVFPLSLDVGYSMLRSDFKEGELALVTHHPLPVTEEPLCLLLSKKVAGNDKLITVFNRGLKRLRESGKVDQYIAESRAGLYMPPQGK